MLAETRSFLIRGDDGQEYGPVGLEELREWVRENRAGLGTDVCLHESGARWQPWQDYPELVALLAEATVTPGTLPPGVVLGGLPQRIMACALDIFLSFFLALPVLIVVGMVTRPDFMHQVGLTFIDPVRFPMPVLPPLPDRLIASLIVDSTLILYLTFFHTLHGRTPAKSILRVRVVDQAGNKPSFSKSLLRAVAIIFSINLYGIPIAYAFFNPERRAFHDFVAGTYVVEL